jgi:glucokinase
VIALDVGGTKVAGAVVDARGTLLCRTQAPTNAVAGAEALMATLIAVARRLRDGYPDAGAVGVGSAGQIDHVRGTVIYADENLPGWTGMALRAHLEAALALPVEVDNDVNAMALAEATYGAAAGRRVALVVAVGTGVGGALVVDGHLFGGASGVAGEIGHIPLDDGGPRCSCGKGGCLEAYTAGPRIAAAYASAAGLERPVELPEVATRARAGDQTAQAAFVQAGERLGWALAGLVNTLNPDGIVVGGGVVTAAQDILLGALRAQLARRALGPAREAMAVLPAALGPDAGLIGAALLARTALDGCGVARSGDAT